MPYEVKEKDGKYCVYNKDTGDEKACHEDKESADAQVSLLHQLEKDED